MIVESNTNSLKLLLYILVQTSIGLVKPTLLVFKPAVPPTP